MKNIQSLMLSSDKSLFPQHLQSKKIKVDPITLDQTGESFGVGGENFAKFANASDFKKLASQLIEVDIFEECQGMTEDSFLEITVPVLGLMDLHQSIEFFSSSVLHPSFVGLNGFGAKSSTLDSFPQVDFIKVMDIADNRYEIMLSPTGEVELPEQGIGLFSVIKEITFVLGYRQVISGEGLTSLQSEGSKKGKLYLLAPIGTDEPFTFHVCLTHIDEINRRLVDSIRAVEVNFTEMPLSWEAKGTILGNHNSHVIERNYIDLSIKLKNVAALTRAVLVNVALKHNPAISFSPSELNAWTQHPLHSNVFTKRFGLSQKTLALLIKELYTEFDFMRDYLERNPIPLSQANDYNNFLLRPEVFVKLYEGLIHDLSWGYIKGDFLLSRVSPERLQELDISEMPVDFHDSVVVSQLQAEFDKGQLESFGMLLSSRASASSMVISDGFFLDIDCPPTVTPELEIEVLIESAENQNEADNTPKRAKNRPK